MPKPTMAIINTSPLLYLHQVNHLEILHNLYGNVITPEAVIQEISVGQTQGINVPDVSKINWIRVVAINSSMMF